MAQQEKKDQAAFFSNTEGDNTPPVNVAFLYKKPDKKIYSSIPLLYWQALLLLCDSVNKHRAVQHSKPHHSGNAQYFSRAQRVDMARASAMDRTRHCCVPGMYLRLQPFIGKHWQMDAPQGEIEAPGG